MVKIFCKIIFEAIFEEIITAEWGSIKVFAVPCSPLIEVLL